MGLLKTLARGTIASPFIAYKDFKKARNEGKSVGSAFKHAVHEHFNDIKKHPGLMVASTATGIPLGQIAGGVASLTADKTGPAASSPPDVTSQAFESLLNEAIFGSLSEGLLG